MSLYYSLSDIVILGGSFINKGGHNPIEPARNNCVVVTGPYIYNWENIYNDMSKNKACLICKNTNELNNLINSYLKNTSKIKIYKTKAKKFAIKSSFEMNKLILKINNSFKN